MIEVNFLYISLNINLVDGRNGKKGEMKTWKLASF